jgi:excisionase family DNA binding protein
MLAGSEYVSATEAARILGVSTRTLSRWLVDGRIPSTKIGRAHRIPRAALGGEGPGTGRSWDATVDVPMDYRSNQLSKNRIYRAGNQRLGLTDDARSWKGQLAESVRMAFVANGARALALPVAIDVRTRFTSEYRALDPQNLVELIADAVQEATGINDRNYKITSWPPVYDPQQEAEIRVIVTARASA